MITTSSSEPDLEVDVLIIGAGISGLTAAARASQDGASVFVVEKSGAVGGSAALALGFFWTTKNAAVTSFSVVYL